MCAANLPANIQTIFGTNWQFNSALTLWERQSYWKGNLPRGAPVINPRSHGRGGPILLHEGPSGMGGLSPRQTGHSQSPA